MSTSGPEVLIPAKALDAAQRRRIRNGVFCLATLALAMYLGFIALLVYRSHH